MNTDDEPGSERPRTRAEARAARAAAEREAAEREATEREAAVTPDEAAPAEERSRGSLSEQNETKRTERASGSRRVPQPEVPAIPLAPEGEWLRSPRQESPQQWAPQESPAGASPRGPLSEERSDETKRGERAEGESTRPQQLTSRRFLYTIFGVVGALVLVVAGLGAISLFQGPRIDQVQVDAAEAIQVSGSRVILTANQSLQDIDESQVTVDPAVPFTVDAAGRSIGIRFTVPLDDATEYTVSVAGVTGAGGGPASDLQATFTTPEAEIFLLNRSDEDDTIFRADLNGDGVPVFTHPRINDYRATSNRLVVAVEDDDGSRILVMDQDGTNVDELALPGDGYVSSVQVSDRGGLVGYTYSDREITADSGRASVLVTQPLSGEGEPQIVEVGGEEASIAEWQFVPDSAAVVFIDFDGALSLDDRSGDAGAQNMGLAMRLLGVSRGTYTAIVERIDQSVVELNLEDGSETPLAAPTPDFGRATTITPFPGGTLRHVVARDANGLPTGQAIIRVDDEGVAEPLLEIESGNAIVQACPSPSGQYAAITVAPNLIDNPYDDLLVPLPKTMETHLLDLRSGEELVALTGFDVSWCQMAPRF